MAAKEVIGISPIYCIKHSIIISRKIACAIPATGVRPPFSMLVAVRAIAPVAGNPPNKAAATLAAPVAISSILERCFLPIIPSATTAESKLSIPAKKAIVKEAGSNFLMVASVISPGIWGQTKVLSTAPKVKVIVATSKCANFTAKVVMIRAAKEPGSAFHFLGQKMIIAKVKRPTAKVSQFTADKW